MTSLAFYIFLSILSVQKCISGPPFPRKASEFHQHDSSILSNRLYAPCVSTMMQTGPNICSLIPTPLYSYLLLTLTFPWRCWPAASPSHAQPWPAGPPRHLLRPLTSNWGPDVPVRLGASYIHSSKSKGWRRSKCGGGQF